MLNSSHNLYAVGVGDFIAYKGDQLVAMGTVNTDTSFAVSASNLDIRGGKRAPLLMRYFHSSEATFSIIAANYDPAIWKASMGGEDRAFSNLPSDEEVVMATRQITLANTPVAVGDISAKVWVRYGGRVIGAIPAATNTITIPSDGAFASIPDNSTICVLYNYKNINATAVTIPAEINPDIWHIFIDVDLATDKAGAGIVGRTVIEIPLAQLDPAQEFSATVDGYSQSRLTGIMLADKTGSGCKGKGIYAYMNTEILDQSWFDNVYAIANDLDNVTLAYTTTYTLNLLGIEFAGTYQVIDPDKFVNLVFNFSAGTANGTQFNQQTGVITAGSTAGTATLSISVQDDEGQAVTRIPTYTLEIEVEAGN